MHIQRFDKQIHIQRAVGGVFARRHRKLAAAQVNGGFVIPYLADVTTADRVEFDGVTLAIVELDQVPASTPERRLLRIRTAGAS